MTAATVTDPAAGPPASDCSTPGCGGESLFALVDYERPRPELGRPGHRRSRPVCAACWREAIWAQCRSLQAAVGPEAAVILESEEHGDGQSV